MCPYLKTESEMQNLDSRAKYGGYLSLGAALRLVTTQIANQSANARLDAELLVMSVCGVSRTELITRQENALTEVQVRQLYELVSRRKKGEPIAYLTRTREFWSMELAVSPATLIPRPETEVLVEQALACIPAGADWTIADIGTGCGAIALALASERPSCRVIATDQVQDALDIARENAARHRLSTVTFRHGSWLEPLAGETMDVIVSNPPYVRTGDPHLTSGDVRFEPVDALAAGADGLDAIRHIVTHAQSCLRMRGWLLLEHGYDQGASVTRIMRQSRYINITTHQDLADRERVTRCQAP